MQKWNRQLLNEMNSHDQGPDLYAFIGFVGPDGDDLNWLLILIFDY